METIIYSIMIFIIGICFGSFFNVVGYRLPNNMSISFPPSHCTSCNHKLGVFELIPILSYIFQGGKCKHCKIKISCFYPIFEFLTGVLFVICYLVFKDEYPEVLNIIYAMLFISSLIIIIISDIKYMIIPDEVLIFFGVILVILKMIIIYKLNPNNTFLDMGYEFVFILLDGIVMFSFMYLVRLLGNALFKKDSMGGGDIKMMTFVSLIIGWKLSIVVVFLASFLALPISIINMYKNKEHVLAFGPYLAIATMILFLSKIDFSTILEFIR